MSAPDLSVYYAVHQALRTAAQRLAATAGTLDTADRRQRKAYRAYWKGYTGEVLAHHTVEDDYLFLALANRVPASRDHMARLSTDHHDLDTLMAEGNVAIERVAEGRDGAAAGAASLLRELASHMNAHLDFEDAHILPLFERHFTGEEYNRLDEQAMHSLGIGTQAAFSVPFVVSSVAPEERAGLMVQAPMPLRVLYQMTRRRYDRMLVTAFGAEAETTAAALQLPTAYTGAA